MKIIINDQELINLFHNRISEIYYEKQIVPLRGFGKNGNDCPYTLPNGKQFLLWFSEIFGNIPSGKEEKSRIDDLLFLSDEIIYFIALLYLYRPFVDNPLDSSTSVGGQFFCIGKDQTVAEKRYEFFVDILYEKIYSFFDRIANLISLFFPEEFKKKNIHFISVIDKLETTYNTDTNFAWLVNFRKNEFACLNKQRKSAVHNLSTVTKNFNEQMLENYANKEGTEQLYNLRIQYPDYFKEMHKLCIDGFEKTLGFLESVKNGR